MRVNTVFCAQKQYKNTEEENSFYHSHSSVPFRKKIYIYLMQKCYMLFAIYRMLFPESLGRIKHAQFK